MLHRIYAIISARTFRLYIGRSRSELRVRFNNHVASWNKYRRTNGMSPFLSSFDVLDDGEASIVLIDTAETEEAARQLEQHYLDRFRGYCVNRNHACVDPVTRRRVYDRKYQEKQRKLREMRRALK